MAWHREDSIQNGTQNGSSYSFRVVDNEFAFDSVFLVVAHR